MSIISIGEPIITKVGTKISRYVENGRMFKLVDFSQSTNQVAKKKGLTRTLVTYGDGNKPVHIQDTFERSIPVKAQEKPNFKVAEAVEAEGKQEKATLDSYRKTDKKSILYKGYDKFIQETKQKLPKYKDILPKSLYDDIAQKYGTEEKSIRKILEEHSFDPDKLHSKWAADNIRYRGFRTFIKTIEKKEQEFANIRTADEATKRSVVMTNAWTSSRLRADLGNECAYGKPWSILKNVWQKCIYPDHTKYSTDKLIDAYLVYMYQAGKRNFYGGNPLKKFADSGKLDKSSMRLLKMLYKYSGNLDNERQLLKSPMYKQMKESVNIQEMTKTIEDLEEHYKNAFFKQFWTDERKERFAKALADEYAKFDEKVELSNDIYEAIMREVFVE